MLRVYKMALSILVYVRRAAESCASSRLRVSQRFRDKRKCEVYFVRVEMAANTAHTPDGRGGVLIYNGEVCVVFMRTM